MNSNVTAWLPNWNTVIKWLFSCFYLSIFWIQQNNPILCPPSHQTHLLRALCHVAHTLLKLVKCVSRVYFYFYFFINSTHLQRCTWFLFYLFIFLSLWFYSWRCPKVTPLHVDLFAVQKIWANNDDFLEEFCNTYDFIRLKSGSVSFSIGVPLSPYKCCKYAKKL